MATVTMPSAKPSVIREFLRIVVPLLILAAGIGFFWISGSLKETAKTPPSDTRAPRVATAEVTGYGGDLQIEVDGTVVPFREMTLTSEVAGRIKFRSPLCQAGRFVPKGTLLLEVDPRDYELEVARLEHELRQTKIAVQEVDVQLDNLRSLATLAEEDQGLQSREVQRLRRLVGDQAIAQSDLDRARSTEVLSRNAVQRLTNESRLLAAKRDSTMAAIDLVKTRLEQARLNLTRTRIVAPIDGVVVQDHVEENDFVQRGTSLIDFEDTSAVEVKCNLLAEEVAWLTRTGDQPTTSASAYEPPKITATIIYQRAGQKYEWDGILSRYDGIGMDEKTRMIPCRFLVKDPNSGRVRESSQASGDARFAQVPTLMRGMFVNVIMSIPTDIRLVEIPLTAVQLGDEVWRVVNDHLEVIPIDIARRTKNSVIVVLDDSSQSLQIGDRIVTTPLATAIDGMPVTLADTPPEVSTETESIRNEDVPSERGAVRGSSPGQWPERENTT